MVRVEGRIEMFVVEERKDREVSGRGWRSVSGGRRKIEKLVLVKVRSVSGEGMTGEVFVVWEGKD